MTGIVPDLRYILWSDVNAWVAKLTAKVFANFLIWIYNSWNEHSQYPIFYCSVITWFNGNWETLHFLCNV